MATLEEFLALQMQNMQMLNTQLQQMQSQMSSLSTTIPVTNTSNVPWPKPLQVETGDIRDNFELFKSNWEEYEVATGMNCWEAHRESQKVNILLSVLGDAAKVKYNNFNLTTEDKKSTKTVLDKISNQLVRKEQPLYERWLFYNCNQMLNEDFDSYLVRLTKISANCQFEKIPADKIKDIMLRDKLAFGIASAELKKRFLKENLDKLTLQEIIDQCKIHEATEDRFKLITKEDTNNTVNKVMSKGIALRTCKFCGKKHIFEKDICPARNALCTFCKVKGHYEKCCFKKQKKRKRGNIKELKQDSTSESDSEEIQVIAKVTDNTLNGGWVTTELDLQFNESWKKVECQLDTGASVCLIGHKYLQEMFNKKIPQLTQSKYRLKGFGGSIIPVKGEILIPCTHKKKKYKILFQVVDVEHGPLLSAKACKSLGLIKYCKKVTINPNLQDGYQQAQQIVTQYKDIFEGQGLLAGEVELEIDNEIKPIIQPARRIPINLRDKLKKELDCLVKEKIIVREEQHTEWVSNILLVQKKNSFRICLDPIPLNAALKRPHFQFNTIDEILPELGKAKVFTTVDTTKGFWHLKLTEKSSKLTTFWTPYGRYRWLRLPFGVSPAPELFAMKIYQLLQDLHGIEVMADDILIYGCGDTIEEALVDHNKNLKTLFQRLSENNVKLNKTKLNLCQNEVKFYGHVLTNEGLKPDMTKVTAIKNMPVPTNKQELHRFLGMVTYLSRYIKNLSSQTVYLRKLLRNDSVWKWEQPEYEEFIKLKDSICDTKTLIYYKSNEPVILECDASSEGLGAIIYQEKGIIAYASRVLTKPERNYAMIEKELLGILFACTRFNEYIIGNPSVIIKTDHKPLLSIFSKPLLKAPKRLQAMMMQLQKYNFKLQYVPGKDNIVADTLSRATVEEKESEGKEKDIFRVIATINTIKGLMITDERLDSIRTETQKDQSLQKLINMIIYGWPRHIKDVPDDIKIYHKYKQELSLQKGLITKSDRILIPFTLRKTLKDKLHVSHNGIENTLKLAKQNIFWPGMSTEIIEKIRNCQVCLKHATNQQKLPMMSSPIPNYPWQILSMDICFIQHEDQQRKVLVLVDHYSDYFEITYLKNLTPNAVISSLKESFGRYGVPELLISDQGTHFVNQQMEDFSRKFNFKHVASSPYHQQTNGKAESTVKIVKNLIKKSEETKEDLWWMLLHWRNTPNKIGISPVQRLMNRQTRHGIPSLNLTPKSLEGVPEMIKKNHQQSKYYYDKKTKNLPDLHVGEKIQIQLKPNISKMWTPGTVDKQLSDRSYIVNTNGRLYQRNRVNLKPYFEDNNEEISGPSTKDLSETSESNISDDREFQISDREFGTKQSDREVVTKSDHKRDTKQDGNKEDVQSPSSTPQPKTKRQRMLPAKFKDYYLYN